MNAVKNAQNIPAHLPERLTISFPIWGMFDTDGKGAYADFDKMMVEHIERGFNCIRLEDCAGLMHDPDGNLLPPVKLRGAWGQFTGYMRQSLPFTPGGCCDTRQRLIDLFTAAKKHNIYIILSSWYFLHTYWYADDPALNNGIYAIDPHKRFMAFAKYLHYILCELEQRGLDSQLAFAEIFNEADGLRFCGGYDNMYDCPVEERRRFRQEHSEALAFLREQHPQLLFAYDVAWPQLDTNLSPENAQVFNFHSYFMWSAYDEFHADPDRWLKKDRYSREDVINSSNFPDLLPEDWIERVWFYINLDPAKIPEAETFLTESFVRNIDVYRGKRQRNLDQAQEHCQTLYPDSLIVCGEGVSYIGTEKLLFEEKCPEYWELLRETMLKYREYGLWGTVVRTCCGPEDPVWTMCPDKLLEINNTFLHGANA